MHEFRPWGDLPAGILFSIADRLGIIELLCFRGTCKDFRSASSTASAKIESSRTPWLLSVEPSSSNCVIYNPHESKTYHKNIPELRDVMFLASYQGWLLLYKEKSIFFFSPFSGAKIVLPNIPYLTENYGAAFSDLPIHPHCTVSIMVSDHVFVISKGQSEWACHCIPRNYPFRNVIDSATFDYKSQTFYFMDVDKSVTFSVEAKQKWNCYPLKDSYQLPYDYVKDPFRNMAMDTRDHFDFNGRRRYIYVCGITFHEPITSRQLVYINELEGVCRCKEHVQASVWIQPRFFEADPNQHW